MGVNEQVAAEGYYYSRPYGAMVVVLPRVIALYLTDHHRHLLVILYMMRWYVWFFTTCALVRHVKKGEIG